MYIEVLHDTNGNILNCYCTDTLPVNSAHALFSIEGGIPTGLSHARINLSTIDVLEIESACGLKAIIDAQTGLPSIVNVDRTSYILGAYKIDTLTEISIPPSVVLPEGVMMRGLLKR